MGISQMFMKLAEGMATSCWIFGITLLFSLPLGMVIAFGRMSKKRIVQGITKIYISIMRGTPLMLQLMVVYFGPYYLFGIKISPFYRNIAVVIGFVLNYAAYFAEIYRSGIESMPVGQYEAAEILGYSKSQTFLHIILPQGMATSCWIFGITLLFSLPLGMVIAFGRMSKKRIVQGITKIYISIMRGTPLMLQLMVVYFGPYYLFGIKISPFYRNIAVVIGFVLNYAAYFAEIYRSGIESMPVGQYEAAEILGYSKSQTFLHIILPQVIKRILPSVTNEVITLVKDTSLAFVIAVSEMFTIAKALASSQTSMVPYVAAGIFYYVFNFLVAWIMEKIEKHLSYYR